VDELKNVFMTGEVTIRLNEIQQMIQTFDKNSDGKIDYMEFIDAMVNSS
jgi:Ca2+-binding EF-hand superfamily protein